MHHARAATSSNVMHSTRPRSLGLWALGNSPPAVDVPIVLSRATPASNLNNEDFHTGHKSSQI